MCFVKIKTEYFRKYLLISRVSILVELLAVRPILFLTSYYVRASERGEHLE